MKLKNNKTYLYSEVNMHKRQRQYAQCAETETETETETTNVCVRVYWKNIQGCNNWQ